MSTRAVVIPLHNPSEAPLRVLIEPWAVTLEVPPLSELRVVMTGPSEGTHEEWLDPSGTVVLFGWPGAVFRVEDDAGQTVLDVPIAVPGVPKGMSTYDFIAAAFGAPEKPSGKA